MDRHCELAAATLALGLLGTSPALADESSDGWHVSLTPYLWMIGVSGDLTLPGQDLSADFGDLWDHLDAGFLGKGEVRYDRFGVLGDVLYLKISGTNTRDLAHLPIIDTKTKLSATSATFAGFYRVYDTEQWNVDLLAGARYNDFKTELHATAGGPGGSRSVSKDWTDPIIGVRANVRTGKKGSLTGYADYGGFGVNDATEWQVMGSYNYQWTENWSVSAGYRYFAVNVDKGESQYDLTLAGPLIGVTFTF
jgi:hypothetical protein